MPPRVTLTNPSKLGTQDLSGSESVNPYFPGTGWNVVFSPGDLGVRETEFECYHIALDGPIGASAVVLINRKQWDYVSQAFANGWDPSQPMIIRFGQSVQFCWNRAFVAGPYNKTTNIQPVVTLWLRRLTVRTAAPPSAGMPQEAMFEPSYVPGI